MGDKTGIGWTDATWNPTIGCSRVSPGCQHCYAEVQAARIVRMGKGLPTAYDGLVKRDAHGEPRAHWTGVVKLLAERLAQPLSWRKPRRIFVNSMSDLFHERLTNEQIAAVFGVMAACPQHTFQVLTKRAKRMREWFEWAAQHGDGYDTLRFAPSGLLTCAWEIASGDSVEEWDLGEKLQGLPDSETFGTRWPLPNVWLGVSVENQEAADERIPELLRTPAAVRFLSCEPLIGPVDLAYGLQTGLERLDWIIAGCESGPGARPCSVEWLRSLRDQCAAVGVAFFLKQATDEPETCNECGERVRYRARDEHNADASCGCTVEGAEDCELRGVMEGCESRRKPGNVIELPYLDGVQHAAFPEVERTIHG